jgi:hypothetical protein
LGSIVTKILEMNHPTLEEFFIMIEEIGVSGTGLKSSIRELDPEDQNVVGKPFVKPFTRCLICGSVYFCLKFLRH